MRRFLAAVAAFALLVSAPASAADVVDRITPAKLGEILKAMTGKDVEFSKGDDGTEIVSVNTGNGYDDFIMDKCTAQGCTEIQMTCFFNKDDRLTLAAVNAFNGSSLNAQAALKPNGNVYLYRLFVTEGGVTEANVRANIEIYMVADDIFLQTLDTQKVASLPPAGVPVSAMKPESRHWPAALPARMIKNIDRLSANPNRAHKPK
ncbi:MAG: YbjN domain-containing protein [Alphaproteobacteria bacterium]|nr:YbjN domain-containing protein [Alphaproteobacteria bacterium]